MARFAGVGLVHTEAVGIDVKNRLVHCKDGRPPVRYDVLSIDIGSTPKFVESQVGARPGLQLAIDSVVRRRADGCSTK